MKTIEQFRAWALTAARIFASNTSRHSIHRDFAEDVRPFDPVLADLYVKAAEANEAIRAHITKRVHVPEVPGERSDV